MDEIVENAFFKHPLNALDLPEEARLRHELSNAYELMLKKYAALQAADLYAHFSPVGLINHKKVLSDFTGYSGDSIGVTSSIWDRIKTVGEDRFYRVEYDPNPQKSKEMKDTEKREKDKKYVEENGMELLIDTAIADSDYVKNVVEAFVNKNEKIGEKLYQETK